MTNETSFNVTDDQNSTLVNIIQKEKLIRLSTPLRKWTKKINRVTTETSSNVTDDQDSTIGNIIQKEDLNRVSTPVRKWTKKK